jgi:predicted nucleic acid-binding protein
MMIIILDTSFLFALRSTRDRYHERAYEIFKEIEEKKPKFFTNYFIMNETLTLAVNRSNGNLSFLEQYISLFFEKDNFFQIIQNNPGDYKKIVAVYKKYVEAKRLLSFADASLIYLYQQLSANCIISFDSHFDTILNRKF